MRSCNECVHGVKQEGEYLVRCDFPLPIWITRGLLMSIPGGELVDRVDAGWIHRCPTYQPREERET